MNAGSGRAVACRTRWRDACHADRAACTCGLFASPSSIRAAKRSSPWVAYVSARPASSNGAPRWPGGTTQRADGGGPCATLGVAAPPTGDAADGTGAHKKAPAKASAPKAAMRRLRKLAGLETPEGKDRREARVGQQIATVVADVFQEEVAEGQARCSLACRKVKTPRTLHRSRCRRNTWSAHAESLPDDQETRIGAGRANTSDFPSGCRRHGKFASRPPNRKKPFSLLRRCTRPMHAPAPQCSKAPTATAASRRNRVAPACTAAVRAWPPREPSDGRTDYQAATLATDDGPPRSRPTVVDDPRPTLDQPDHGRDLAPIILRPPPPPLC